MFAYLRRQCILISDTHTRLMCVCVRVCVLLIQPFYKSCINSRYSRYLLAIHSPSVCTCACFRMSACICGLSYSVTFCEHFYTKPPYNTLGVHAYHVLPRRELNSYPWCCCSNALLFKWRQTGPPNKDVEEAVKGERLVSRNRF